MPFARKYDINTMIANPGVDCIEWPGGKNQKGYGLVAVPNTRRTVAAHRLAYAVAHKIDVFGIKNFVCHSCDNPSCINPNHLWQGTAKDNAADRDMKGRAGNVGGVRVLSDEDCHCILTLWYGGMGIGQVAECYGLGLTTINKVLRGAY